MNLHKTSNSMKDVTHILLSAWVFKVAEEGRRPPWERRCLGEWCLLLVVAEEVRADTFQDPAFVHFLFVDLAGVGDALD